MIYIFFAVILLILEPILLFFYIKYRAMRAYHEFFDTPNDKTPSQFATILDTGAQLFAARLMQSLRAQLANMNSITTRQANAAAGEGMIEGLAGSGGIAGALTSIPGVEKMIRKNPLLGLAAQFVLSKMGNTQANSEQADKTRTQPQGTGAEWVNGQWVNGHAAVDPFAL